jgi:hypothetical protein
MWRSYCSAAAFADAAPREAIADIEPPRDTLFVEGV